MLGNLILIGAGGHCRSCIDAIELEGKWKIAGILGLPEEVGLHIQGYEVIDTDTKIPVLSKKGVYFLVCIGQIYDAEPRKKCYRFLKAHDAKLATVVSPLAYVSKHASIGDGTIVMHGSIVNADAKVGVNCILNSKSLIEHGTQIGDHCHVATNAVINGDSIVGHSSFIGSGATVCQRLTVPSESFIKAGTVVKI